jgi:hypothetical protein
MGVISNGLGSTNIKDGRGFMLLTIFTVPTTVAIEPFASHFFINGFITRCLLTFLLLPGGKSANFHGNLQKNLRKY